MYGEVLNLRGKHYNPEEGPNTLSFSRRGSVGQEVKVG